MAYNIIKDEALTEILKKSKQGLAGKVDKKDGYGLSKNDYTDAEKTKLSDTAAKVATLETTGGQANVIETVKVNGTALTPDSQKAVDITVPTTAQIKSQIEAYKYQTAENVNTIIDGKGFQTSEEVETAITGKGYQTAANVKATVEGYGYQTSSQVSSAITEAIKNQESKRYVKVESFDKLPTTGENGVIYLVPHTHNDGANDGYDEYFWNAADKKYEKYGNTDVNLEGYVQDSDLTEVDAAKIDTLWDAITV